MDLIAKKAKTLKTSAKKDFGAKPVKQLPTLVETAVAAGTFTKLVAAVQAAGLVDTLNGGPFTVLAPSDEAFAKLPEGALDALLADKKKLTDVLKYHVISGFVNANVVKTLKDKNAETLLAGKGPAVKLSKDEKITLDTASVVTPNIKTRNGLIHVIDAVLMPPADAPPADA